MDFSGKRVIVTGSTRGIGRETARLFLEAGADVVIHGRSRDGVDDTVAALAGGKGIAADLSRIEGCRQLIDKAIDHLGGLDVLVNNAAVGDGGTIAESDETLWQTTMDINLRAPFFLTRHALPALRASRGNVIMVSSVSGLMGHPGGITVYCTSGGPQQHDAGHGPGTGRRGPCQCRRPRACRHGHAPDPCTPVR